MRYYLSLPITSVLILLFLSSSTAQWSNDPYENTLVADYAREPLMVSDGSGGAIIAFQSYHDSSIYAQRVDKFGYKRWGEYGVRAAIGHQIYQSYTFDLCEDDNGGCYMSIVDYVTLYPYYYTQLIVQRIDSLGNRLWGDSGSVVCDLDSNSVASSQVVTEGMNGAFVIWVDQRNSPFYTVYGQHLDDVGNPTWTHNGIVISDGIDYGNILPEAIYGGPGYTLAYWHGNSGLLWSQKIDMYGNFHWGEAGIQLPDYLGSRNCYISDGNSGCVLTGRYRISPTSYVFNAQRMDDSGALIWGSSGIMLSDTASTNSFYVSLAQNNSGTYFAWSDDRTGTMTIYIQRVERNGLVLWQPLGMPISSPDSTGSKPAVTSTQFSNVIVAYLDQRGQSVRCQKFDSSGIAAWTPDNIVISYIDEFFYHTYIISDGAGGAIVCWSMYPGHVYIQQVSADGNLGEVLAVYEEPFANIPAKITLFQNYPNPFNASARIYYSLDRSTSVRLVINDILGRQVATLVDGEQAMGSYSVIWDASNIASGTYFVLLEAGKDVRTVKMTLLK